MILYPPTVNDPQVYDPAASSTSKRLTCSAPQCDACANSGCYCTREAGACEYSSSYGERLWAPHMRTRTILAGSGRCVWGMRSTEGT
jgi:hypothetical protein